MSAAPPLSRAVADRSGLTSAEAAARLARVGPNRLAPRAGAGRAGDLLRSLLDPMALMLLAAAALNLALGQVRDGVILLVALAPVLAVDVVLEARSRAALKRLAEAAAPRARVLRDGEPAELRTEDVVPGDLLLLREGDGVAADAVVRRARHLSLDESALTGESEPAARSAWSGLSESGPPESLLFAGTLVVSGDATAEVVATGSRTRHARIAALVADDSVELTPLQRRTSRMVRRLAVVAVALAAVVGLLEIARGHAPLQAATSAISVAMSAVPEEFPLVFALFLSLGAWRLARRGLLVRRLSSVETLGSATVLCVDKTGTLTAGRFAVATHVPLGDGVTPARLLEASVLACEPEPADPLERAMVEHALGHGVDPAGLLARFRLAHDHDFDPAGRHMSHAWAPRATGEPWRLVAKGALEGILEHCTIGAQGRREAEDANAALAKAGMRVLAVAERLAPGFSGVREADERDLTLLGLVALRDPLRPEVPAAVRECRAAGIAIKVITGDHAITAHAIASAAGILEGGGALVTGDELAALAGEALDERVRSASVFARISPEQKHGIVQSLQRTGEVVAMTGDGVNDAPALRRADIGIAMGRHGTTVARATADLVLLEDDLGALVTTVREGRRIYRNVQSAFLWLLAFHVPIVGLALAMPLLDLPLLLLPVHLVWLELIVHPVSALVFEGEPATPELMTRPPRRRDEPLLPRRLAMRSVMTGLALTIAAIMAFVAHLGAGVDAARSLALATLVLGSVLLAIVERRADGARIAWLPRGARTWIVLGAVVASLPFAMHAGPVARALQIVPLGAGEWATAVALAVLAIGWRAWPIRSR